VDKIPSRNSFHPYLINCKFPSPTHVHGAMLSVCIPGTERFASARTFKWEAGFYTSGPLDMLDDWDNLHHQDSNDVCYGSSIFHLSGRCTQPHSVARQSAPALLEIVAFPGIPTVPAYIFCVTLSDKSLKGIRQYVVSWMDWKSRIWTIHPYVG